MLALSIIDGFVINAGPVSITDNNQDSKVRYFPNPSDGQINFVADGLTSGPLVLEVIDIGGRTVLTQNYITTGAQFNSQIDLTGLSKGMYFVKLKSGNDTRVDRIVFN